MTDTLAPGCGENLLAGTTVFYDSLAASPSAALLGAMGFTHHRGLRRPPRRRLPSAPPLRLLVPLRPTSVDGFGATMAAAGLSSLASVLFGRSGLLDLSGLVWANGWGL